MCTLADIPRTPAHCVEWAKQLEWDRCVCVCVCVCLCVCERDVRPWCTRHGFVTFTLVSVLCLCDTHLASLAFACPAYTSAIPGKYGPACSFPHFVMHLTARLSLWIVLPRLVALSRTRVHAKCRSAGTCGRSTADVCSLLLSPKRVSGRCW